MAQDGRGVEALGQVTSDAGPPSRKDRKPRRKAANYAQFTSTPREGGDERAEELGDSGGRGLTRSERNIAWIEKHCVLPEGPQVGQPVKLTDHQKAWIRQIYDTPTRTFILSLARKNAKTALAAFLLLLHLRGPEAKVNGQLFSTAQSRDQAALLFDLAAKTVRLSETLRKTVFPRDTWKQLHCPAKGTLYRALSADASTAYGLSPSFVVHDELGQVKGPRSELYEALETASGVQEDPLSVIISTQAPGHGDLLSTLIDDAGKDPRIKVVLYSAPESLDPFSEEAIRAANPHFDVFMNRVEVLGKAASAKRLPSLEASYRNLVLNQRVEAHSPFVPRDVWLSNGSKPPEMDGPLFLGLDLSAVADLTALVSVSPSPEGWGVWPQFWLPEHGLAEKSRNDRQEYDRWAREGLLSTTPGKAIQYEYVAEYLRGLFDRCDVRKVAFDRWNMKHLRPWLERAGFTEEELSRFVEFGQGFQAMSPALRTLEALLLEGRLQHGNHPVLEMCARHAVVQTDPAGNRKFTKAKASGRIDGMVALAMAVSVASGEQEEQQYVTGPLLSL
jgi:phage terminase large subunit-like protein